MESYVIVWENNTPGHRKVSGRTWPGHASMNIGDFFDKDEVDVALLNSYVSWWPSQGASFGVKDLFSKTQKGAHSISIIDDIGSEGYLPDHVIKLATTSEVEEKMRAEWRTVFMKASGASYKEFRKNCSTIVSRCLHAGGFYARKWAIDCNWVWSPGDVARLALAAGGTNMTWTDFLKRLAVSDIKPSDWGDDVKARSGRLCTTGAPCQYQQDG